LITIIMKLYAVNSIGERNYNILNNDLGHLC
jgi:hypothetical protein